MNNSALLAKLIAAAIVPRRAQEQVGPGRRRQQSVSRSCRGRGAGNLTIQFESDEKFRGVVSLMVNLNSL
jgi:hypothetical protein